MDVNSKSTRDGCTACFKCSKMCLINHFNTKRLSFFIIMTAEMSSILDLPANTIKDISSHRCIKIILEGSNGQLWNALLYFGLQCPFIKDGWSSFVNDNSLQCGDILVFRCLSESHYLVQIFSFDGDEKEKASYVGVTNSVYAKTSSVTNSLYAKTSSAHGFSNSKSYRTINRSVENRNTLFEGFMSGTRGINITQNLKNLSSCSQIKRKNNVPGNPSKSHRESAKQHTIKAEKYFHSNPSLRGPKVEINAPDVVGIVSQTSKHEKGSVLADPIVIEDDDGMDSKPSPSSSSCDDTDDANYDSGSEVLQERFHMSSTKNCMPSTVAEFRKTKFSVEMSNTAVKRPFVVCIPKDVGENYFPRRRAYVKLVHMGRSWNVKYNGQRKYPVISAGWMDFVRDNDVKLGDTCTFEVEDENNKIKVTII